VHHLQEPAIAGLVMSTFDLPNDFQHDRPANSDAGARPAGDQPSSPPGGRHAGVHRPRVLSLGSLLDSVREDLFSGKRPIQYAVASEPWGSIALRPGDVIGLAAPPGNGKTALAMQFVVDALRQHPDARCLNVNVEMSPAKLIERQISRLSGVSYTDIDGRTMIGLHARQIEAAIATLASIGDRLFFMREPYDLETIALSLQDVQPTILVLDYVQRIECCGGQLEARIRLNNVMSEARNIASAGIAVMLVSAVGRTTSKRNGGYNSRELGMGSFRESSEIEYGVDDAFVLTDEDGSGEDNGGGPRVMMLRHVKSRNHQRKDLRLEFDGAVQQFRLLPDRADGDDGDFGPIGVVPPPPPGRSPTPPSTPRSTPPAIDTWSFDFPGDEAE
jgi:replicative DNA helicase